MPVKLELNMSPEESANEDLILAEIFNHTGLRNARYKKLKQSIDARKRNIRIRLVIEVYNEGEELPETGWTFQKPRSTKNKRVIIAGFGPAGMFAGLCRVTGNIFFFFKYFRISRSCCE